MSPTTTSPPGSSASWIAPYSSSLLGVVRDVVERERRDDGVAAREPLLEAAAPEVEPAGVRGAPHRAGVEHVRVDVDELHVDLGQRVEDRRREAARPRAEIDDLAAGRARAASSQCTTVASIRSYRGMNLRIVPS